MQRASAVRLTLVILSLFVQPNVGIAEKNRFSQITLNLSTPRQYEWDYDQKRNVVILYIKKTSSVELDALDNYDEATIKRIVVRDIAGQDSEIRFFLRDRALRTTISHFHEPFRINVDVFDTNYKETIDPQSGLPLVPVVQNAQSQNQGFVTGRAPFETTNPAQNDSWETAQKVNQRPKLVQKKHQFLLPDQDISTSGSQAVRNVQDAKHGMGLSWSQYPIYVYRFQTGLHLGDETQQMWMQKNSQAAQESPEAMAEFAGKLYDFKHEYKALEGYKAAMKRKPGIFNNAPLHLWRLAEAHLGTGSLSLADNYYAKFVAQFPQSELHPVAKLRRLDIRAIKAVKRQNLNEFPQLVAEIDAMPSTGDSEVQSLKAIRRAYWKDAASNFDRRTLPNVDQRTKEALTNNLGGLESFQTEFLSRSLLLNNMVGPNYPWSAQTGQFAADYFKKYKSYGNQEYSENLRDKLRKKLEKTIAQKSKNKQFDQVISIYSSLPGPLKSIRKTPFVAWYIAESYRKLGKVDEAADLYGMAAKGANSATNRFKASLWQGVLSEKVRANAAASKRRRLDRNIKAADDAMSSSWDELSMKDKNLLLTTFKDQLTDAVRDGKRLRTPPRVLLEIWDATLTSGTAGSDPKQNLGGPAYSPSAEAFRTMLALSDRFKEQGDKERRARAVKLIQLMRPGQFGSDQNAKDDWTRQIISIAEELRLENNLLESGRLYILAGRESENFENRAETLYKGGLLLYRSGRRTEAVEAFKEAAADGENQFYANLAKERLNRLSN